MSSVFCFICHSKVSGDTNEEIREKYREVVGINLCLDSHLCYICCHILKKLSLFRSLCFKRSLEYPVLISEKETLNLQRSNIELHIQCSDESCQEVSEGKFYQNDFKTHNIEYDEQKYIKLEDNTEHINPDNLSHNADIEKYLNITENAFMHRGYSQIDDNNCISNETHDEFESNDEPDDSTIRSDSKFDDVDSKEITEETHKRKRKLKKKGFQKIVLSLEQQKVELEANRKVKKYIESEFKCYNCALGFLFKDTYQGHMMRHEESNGEYRCELCTLRFATPAVLRSHTSLHSERYKCTRCGTELRPRARVKHLKECWQKRTYTYVTCHLCTNLFKDARGLQQHLRRIHNSKSGRVYPCSICGETSRNQAAVRTHMLKHLKKKFICDQCPATYSSPYTLNQHKKKHLMLEERHFCSLCKVSYSSRKSLKAHQRNSLNHQQTIFECNKCTRVLPHRRALEAHEKKAHSESQFSLLVKPPRGGTIRKESTERGVCHLCGKSFKGNSKLNRHLREVCEKLKLTEQSESIYE